MLRHKTKTLLLLLLSMALLCLNLSATATNISSTLDPSDWKHFNPYKFEPASQLVPGAAANSAKSNLYSHGTPIFPHDPSRSNVIYGRGTKGLPTVIYAKAFDILRIGNKYFQAPAAGESKRVVLNGQSVTIYGTTLYTPLPNNTFVANPAQVVPFDPTRIFYKNNDMWPAVIYGEPGKQITINNQSVTMPAAGKAIIVTIGADGRIKTAGQDRATKSDDRGTSLKSDGGISSGKTSLANSGSAADGTANGENNTGSSTSGSSVNSGSSASSAAEKASVPKALSTTATPSRTLTAPATAMATPTGTAATPASTTSAPASTAATSGATKATLAATPATPAATTATPAATTTAPAATTTAPAATTPAFAALSSGQEIAQSIMPGLAGGQPATLQQAPTEGAPTALDVASAIQAGPDVYHTLSVLVNRAFPAPTISSDEESRITKGLKMMRVLAALTPCADTFSQCLGKIKSAMAHYKIVEEDRSNKDELEAGNEELKLAGQLLASAAECLRESSALVQSGKAEKFGSGQAQSATGQGQSTIGQGQSTIGQGQSTGSQGSGSNSSPTPGVSGGGESLSGKANSAQRASDKNHTSGKVAAAATVQNRTTEAKESRPLGPPVVVGHSGVLYKTREDALKSWAKDIFDITTTTDTEYAMLSYQVDITDEDGNLQKDPNGNIIHRFSYTPSIRGSIDESFPERAWGFLPDNAEFIHDGHTHGGNNPKFKSFEFSKQDKSYADSRQRTFNMLDPSGNIHSWIPAQRAAGIEGYESDKIIKTR